jgi:hypothetical protein
MIAVLFSWSAYSAENFDARCRLIQLTSLDNILRTDAEQAGFIIDRLPEDLPSELRSDLRRVIDSNLDYNKMEDALLKTAFSKLDRSTLDLNSRWWASSSGRLRTGAFLPWRQRGSTYLEHLPGHRRQVSESFYW